MKIVENRFYRLKNGFDMKILKTSKELVKIQRIPKVYAPYAIHIFEITFDNFKEITKEYLFKKGDAFKSDYIKGKIKLKKRLKKVPDKYRDCFKEQEQVWKTSKGYFSENHLYSLMRL